MSIYKLIKEYPGSPQKGTTAKDIGIRYNFINNGVCIGYTQNYGEKKHIEDFPEFWQKYVLKTEDQIYKFLGEEIYIVNRVTLKSKWNLTYSTKLTDSLTLPISETVRYFHSRTSALEFIEEENKKIDNIINNTKPIFSVNDLKELFNFEFIDQEKYNKFLSEKLGNLQ